MSDVGGVRLLAARPALAIWVGHEAVSTLGTAIGNVALPLLVFTATGSPALTGVLTALRVVPHLVHVWTAATFYAALSLGTQS